MSQPLLLMTPGPTRVPDRVLAAGARPMIHHRTAEFSAELAAMLEMLQPVFGTKAPVLPVHTTGRGAMEAAVCNLFSPGDVGDDVEATLWIRRLVIDGGRQQTIGHGQCRGNHSCRATCALRMANHRFG